MLEKNFKFIYLFFFSPLNELCQNHKGEKKKIQLNMNYSYQTFNLDLMMFVTSCGAETVNNKKMKKIVCTKQEFRMM